MGEFFNNKCLYFKDKDNLYKPLGLPSEAIYTNEVMEIPKLKIEINFPVNVNEYFMNEKENTNNSKELTVPLPERYIINENACILFWKNGEKTVVKRCADDEFNPRLAFLTAFFQHYVDMSKNKANKYLANLQVEVEPKQEPKYTEEKTEFKVGDMVKVTKSDNYSKKNWKGEITYVDIDEVKVKYNNGQSWWILKDNVKLIKEEK